MADRRFEGLNIEGSSESMHLLEVAADNMLVIVLTILWLSPDHTMKRSTLNTTVVHIPAYATCTVHDNQP